MTVHEKSATTGADAPWQFSKWTRKSRPGGMLLALATVSRSAWSKSFALPLAPGGKPGTPFTGEQTPAGFRQLLSRDGIRPIYEPAYVPADRAEWPSC